MVDFESTERAFSYKNDAALKHSHRLFSILKYPIIGQLLSVLGGWAIRLKLPVRGLIKNSIYRQFVAGETIEESRNVFEKLYQYCVQSILDFSVEGTEEEEGFKATQTQILNVIHKVKDEASLAVAVIKISGLGSNILLEKISNNSQLTASELKQKKALHTRLDDVFSLACTLQVSVYVDAEESWIQPAIDSFTELFMQKYNKDIPIVFNTIQLYRKDRLDYLKHLHKICTEKNIWMGVKLVRGAYLEKERKEALKKGIPSPIHDKKADTDKDYNLGIKYCFEHLEKIALCLGTHNEESCIYALELLKKHNIDKKDTRVYFSQLYGMSDHISFNLAADGYNSSKYLPYGPLKDTLPYLARRAQENSSIAGQMSKELRLIKQELKRRKL